MESGLSTRVVWLLAAASVGALAQSTPPSLPEIETREAPVLFKSKVNLVSVPVVVRDSSARAVGHLSVSDFQLFDSGKPQLISRFSLESYRPAVQTPVGEVSTPAVLESAPQLEPAAEAPRRFVAYVFDDRRMNLAELTAVREAALQRFKSRLAADERAAIYTTSGTVTLEFTDDPVRFREAIASITHGRKDLPPCPDVSYYMAEVIQNLRDENARKLTVADAAHCLGFDHETPLSSLRRDVGAAAVAAVVEAAIMQALSEGPAESRDSISVLNQVVDRLSMMPGERVMVVASRGFLVTDDLRQTEIDFITRAVRAGVVINALDTRAAMNLSSVADVSRASVSLADPSIAIHRDLYRSWNAAADADVLAEVASGTGGVFLRRGDDLADNFRRSASPPEYVYILGFTPRSLELDGKYHSLKVSLRNPKGLTVQARRGYYAPGYAADPSEQLKRQMEEAFFSNEDVRDLPVTMQTQYVRTGESEATVSVLAKVDVTRLAFTEEDGRKRNDVTLVIGLFDRNGNLVSAIAKTLEMRLLDETLAESLASGVTLRTSFEAAAPGSYMVRIAARDAGRLMMTALTGFVEIP